MLFRAICFDKKKKGIFIQVRGLGPYELERKGNRIEWGEQEVQNIGRGLKALGGKDSSLTAETSRSY